MLQLFFLSYHPISSQEARNISNLTRKHNESFLCMLYIISFFFILILTPCPLTLLLSLFSSIFISIKKSHHFKYPTHAFIHSFILLLYHLFLPFIKRHITFIFFFSLSLFLTSL